MWLKTAGHSDKRISERALAATANEMLYANCDDSKCKATPKRRGTCPYCHSEVLAKCGPTYIWHWAHVSEAGCDPWWEGESDWHRKWKNFFPIECQEVIQHDPKTNERHVADVRTPNGTVIEFQNSSLTLEELRSRETFYGRMVWIVNGAKFKDNFRIGEKMPSPDAERILNVRIAARNHRMIQSGGQLSLNPNRLEINSLVADPTDDLLTHRAIDQKDDGHRLFRWQHARITWYSAEKPVIFDFGETGLFRMRKHPTYRFFVVKQVAKEKLILKNGGSPHAGTTDWQTGAT